MKKRKRLNVIINIFIFVLSVIFLIESFCGISVFFFGQVVRNHSAFGVLIITVLVVHTIKVLRLYFALYGADIIWKKHFKTYCIVTPVSILFPLKLGELFRMYSYGKQIGNYLRGIVVILLDRFIDTAAIVTILILVGAYTTTDGLSWMIYLLLIFLIVLVVCYFTFPGFCDFWKKWLIRAKGTKRKLWALKVIVSAQTVYNEVEKVIKGRGAILYILSLVAWSVEVGFIIFESKLMNQRDIATVITGYFGASMQGGSENYQLLIFNIISVVVLILGLLVRIIMDFKTDKDGEKR